LEAPCRSKQLLLRACDLFSLNCPYRFSWHNPP
jgi:hypothetical protein